VVPDAPSLDAWTGGEALGGSAVAVETALATSHSAIFGVHPVSAT